MKRQNQYLDFLIESKFQRVNKLFVLSFENDNDRKVRMGHYLPNVELKDYNVMIDAKNVFDKPAKINMTTYNNIQKLQQFKDMITKLVVCWIMIISVNAIKWH